MRRKKIKVTEGQLRARMAMGLIVEAGLIVILLVGVIVSAFRISNLKKQVNQTEAVQAESISVNSSENPKEEKDSLTDEVSEIVSENTISGNDVSEETKEQPKEENYEVSFNAGALAIHAVESDNAEIKSSYEKLENEIHSGEVSMETLEGFNSSIIAFFGEESEYLINLEYKFDSNAWWDGKGYNEFDADITDAYSKGEISKERYDAYKAESNEILSEVSKESFERYIDCYLSVFE